MPKHTSMYLRPALEEALRTRGGNRSEIITRDLARLYDLYRHELAEAELKLTPGEASLIVDVLNGTLITQASHAGFLWAEVADGIKLDGLAEKWNVGGEALVKRLQGLRLAQCLALVDAAERYWAAVSDGQEPRVEEYLPVAEQA